MAHFAGRFELPKKTSSAIIDEVAALAVSETEKARSFTLPGIGRLVLAKGKARLGCNPATGKKDRSKDWGKMRLAKASKGAIVPGRKK
jgi:nucleoid DNA-binding protein